MATNNAESQTPAPGGLMGGDQYSNPYEDMGPEGGGLLAGLAKMPGQFVENITDSVYDYVNRPMKERATEVTVYLADMAIQARKGVNITPQLTELIDDQMTLYPESSNDTLHNINFYNKQYQATRTKKKPGGDAAAKEKLLQAMASPIRQMGGTGAINLNAQLYQGALGDSDASHSANRSVPDGSQQDLFDAQVGKEMQKFMLGIDSGDAKTRQRYFDSARKSRDDWESSGVSTPEYDAVISLAAQGKMKEAQKIAADYFTDLSTKGLATYDDEQRKALGIAATSEEQRNTDKHVMELAKGRQEMDIAAAGEARAQAEADIEAGDREKRKDIDLAGYSRGLRQIERVKEWVQEQGGDSIWGADGMGAWAIMDAVPGTDAYELASLVKQIDANQFMANIERLRGLGHLSNIEGEKASAAISTLDPGAGYSVFMEQLGEAENYLATGMQRAFEGVTVNKKGELKQDGVVIDASTGNEERVVDW